MIATEAPARLYLPPLFTGQALAEGHPFAEAAARASELGAGALLYAERPGLLAFALVLEPETPLAAARRAFPLAMAALADALAALCLPERSVRIGWPDLVLYDAGRIGGGRLAWPGTCPEAAVPDWLVFGADLIRDRDEVAEPGLFPETTSLAEEAFEAPLEIVESFARNVMHRFDLWEVQGYDAAAEDYLRRLADLGEAEGARIGPTGDLLVREPDGHVRARPLLPALASPSWFDPQRGGPRL